MGLAEYRKKRDFKKTKEPSGSLEKDTGDFFVIQRHFARRLHYDFRISHNGVLVSFAVPKGPPLIPAQKRLAVQTEDHPIDYATFKGVIPEGEYGGGVVEFFDRGKYENISKKNHQKISIDEALKKGHLGLKVEGQKINGTYNLVKISGKNWLMLKSKEEIINKVSNSEKIIFEGITKAELVNYYKSVAHLMLPHMWDRPVSMQRFPDGVKGEVFFQKNISTFFPDWIQSTQIEKTKYAICNNIQTLLYIANLVMVPHLWLSRADEAEYPDRMIFDLDPKKEFSTAVKGAFMIKEVLENVGLSSYPMLTGSKGVHVHVPIYRELKYQKVASFAKTIAKHLEKEDPEAFTTEQRIEKRKGEVFIDTYRIAFGQTAVAPYSVRITPQASIAAPIKWTELKPNTNPRKFTLKNFSKRIGEGDVWGEMRLQSLVKAVK